MSSIKEFESKELGFKVATYIDEKQEIWLKGKDIALALGYENTADAIVRHVKAIYRRCASHVPLKNVHPQTIFISEPGLYSLIFGSKLESADKFQDWVFSKVLPSIRKYGQYKLFSNPSNHCVRIANETDLHTKVVECVRRFYPSALITAGLGENQDTAHKRIESYKKGYQRGQPDLIIQNLHKVYSGLVIELKTPTGKGVLSDDQKQLLEAYESNNYKCLVSNDYDLIINQISTYMGDTRVICGHCVRRFKNKTTLARHKKAIHRIE